MNNNTIEELREIEITSISVNRFQPRHNFSTEDLEELAASIKEVGIIHPPLVRPLPHSNRYELISGERRFRAAQLAKLTKIPVIIRYGDDSLSAHAALIENIQRVDLNPIEIAKALKNLATQFDLKQEELALRLGKKRSTIANYLRMMQLPQSIQDSVSDGSISMGHAKAILSLEKANQQLHLHSRILREALNVRDAEKAAKLLQNAKNPQLKSAKRDVHLEDLSNKIQQKLGTKVSIQGKGVKGRIQIDYFNLDDLDRILAILKVE
jgi:ParB family chromosome partitioning protein